MPFDALFLSAVTKELSESLLGCRVDKVQQPERDTLILHMRSPGNAQRLLISASTAHPRVHLSAASMENPAQPPMFCMLLRKHLTGGKLISVTQPPMERLLDFCFDCTDEMGVQVEKHLIAELMGRSANLILLGSDGRIIDCLRRVDFEMSAQRQVLPGLYYHLPQAVEKLDPCQTEAVQIASLLQAQTAQKTFDRWLLDTFGGISPLVCRELSYALCGSVDADVSEFDDSRKQALAEALSAQFAAWQSEPLHPVLLRQDGAPKDFSCIPICQYEGFYQSEELPSYSVLLDAFYTERDRSERLRQKTQTLRKTVTTLQNRTARKLELQRKELTQTKDRERLRRLGDIVTANLHAITRGQVRLEAVDFYDPEMQTIIVALDPALSPQQNAAKFYKDYQKAKTAEKILTEQIAHGEAELSYLSSVLDTLDRAESDRDVQEIRTELTDGRYIRAQGGKKQMKLPPQKPMVFVSSEGCEILVGRNNRQNDLLTLKTALKNDYWLHAQKIPGSHVILVRGETEPGDESFTEAAMLAAYYSQARGGQNIAVDCTNVRHVKKPNGAKPGMVIYDRYRTIYVTPDCERLDGLKKR
ncbi:MAG: NFACT family protein [Oscillospiraceae bacterium]|nr:NFACT family protein [Oscillospiraceae bacterium]